MPRIVDRLGSKHLTAYLVLSYAVFLLFLAVWGARIPKETVGRISGLAPFWLIYVLAALHLGCCLVVWWPSLRRRTSLEFPSAAPRLPVPAFAPDELAAQARQAGLRLRWLEPGSLAVLFRNRFSPLGTALSHAALLLLPVAFLVSRATRFEGQAWIIEGHPFGGTRAEYTSVDPEAAFENRAPRVAFAVEAVDAEFWGDRLFFTDLRALISLPGRRSGDRRIIRLPQPAWVDGARVTLKGFNYTPAFELRDAEGRSLESGDLRLWLFPPGTEDSFRLPGLPYTFWVRLYPDSPGLQPTPGQGQHLGNPLFHVAATCGKRLAGRAWLRPGQAFRLGGYSLSFPAVRRAGEIVVHRDWGYPVLWLALGLALAGTTARIAFPSSRLWLVLEAGRALAVVREDAFSSGRAGAFLERWRAHAR